MTPTITTANNGATRRPEAPEGALTVPTSHTPRVTHDGQEEPVADDSEDDPERPLAPWQAQADAAWAFAGYMPPASIENGYATITSALFEARLRTYATEAARKAWRDHSSRIADHAPDRQPPRFITLAETAAMMTIDEDYVIGDGLLTRGGKLMVYAQAGAGKTTLLGHVAGCLASGRNLFGTHHVDGAHRVLFVQGGLTESEIASHGQDLLDVFRDTEATTNLVFWRNTQLGLPAAEADLRAAIESTRTEILILDPFNRFFRGDNSMTQEQVGEVFRMCDRLLEDTALGLLGIVMAHHANVANARMVGSYDFEGWPSSILRLDLISGNHTQRKMKYEKIRAPRSTYLGKTVLIELGDRGYLYAATETTVQPFAGPLLIRNALRELGGEATRPELIDEEWP